MEKNDLHFRVYEEGLPVEEYLVPNWCVTKLDKTNTWTTAELKLPENLVKRIGFEGDFMEIQIPIDELSIDNVDNVEYRYFIDDLERI